MSTWAQRILSKHKQQYLEKEKKNMINKKQQENIEKKNNTKILYIPIKREYKSIIDIKTKYKFKEWYFNNKYSIDYMFNDWMKLYKNNNIPLIYNRQIVYNNWVHFCYQSSYT
jgi:hypothetical protein